MAAGSSLRLDTHESETLLLRSCVSVRHPLSALLAVDSKLPLGSFVDPLAQLQFLHRFHTLVDGHIAETAAELSKQGLQVTLWKFWRGSHRFVIAATASQPCLHAGASVVATHAHPAAVLLTPLLRPLFELGASVQEAAARTLLPNGEPLAVTLSLHHGGLHTALVGFKRCLQMAGDTADAVEALLDNTPSGGFSMTAGVLELLCPDKVVAGGLVRMACQGPLRLSCGYQAEVWTLYMVPPRAARLQFRTLLRYWCGSSTAAASPSRVGSKDDASGSRAYSSTGAGVGPSSRASQQHSFSPLQEAGGRGRPGSIAMGHDAWAAIGDPSNWPAGRLVRACLLALCLIVSVSGAILRGMGLPLPSSAAACLCTRFLLYSMAWRLRQQAQQPHQRLPRALSLVCQLVGVAASVRVAHSMGLLSSRWSWQLSAADLFFLQALACPRFRCQAVLHWATLALLWLQPLRPARHLATSWAQLLACILYLAGVWVAGRRSAILNSSRSPVTKGSPGAQEPGTVGRPMVPCDGGHTRGCPDRSNTNEAACNRSAPSCDSAACSSSRDGTTWQGLVGPEHQ